MNDELMLLDRAQGLITLQAKKGIPLRIGMNLLVHSSLSSSLIRYKLTLRVYTYLNQWITMSGRENFLSNTLVGLCTI